MTNLDQACSAVTSYMTCSILLHLQAIDWATAGAVLLLVARLVKDVPDAYDAIKKRLKQNKKKRKKTNGKSKR